MKQKQFFTDNDRFNWDYGARSTLFDTISSKNFPAAFFSIIGIMAEDCNYHIRECYNQDTRLFFKGYYYRHESELMLRYGMSELVVARIQFAHRRKGNMTKLFEVLKHIKRSYHLDKIVIECVQTNEMREWCKKNKFIPCGDPEASGINWEWN